ncbi:SpoVR family protein [Thermithiobacillus plumbiphilus]|uniref:SpoVR family protein n=1 Tax=Thermithiobacillus plumbiphilus TaxID=1729899 RepID=A0ABU9D6C0_9PROT
MKYPFETGDWTFEQLDLAVSVIGEIAEEYGLDTYPNQLEVISAEQMIDAYTSIGLPIHYGHWSYGKEFIRTLQSYRRGEMGLAYEMVINSNPCISYLMEENTMVLQTLVIAHAAFGHNAFFKNNYLFRMWTDADGIIDYLVFARDYIRRCEERHGEKRVEFLLDACHALAPYGVDRYQKPKPLSAEDEERRAMERLEFERESYDEVWRTVPIAMTPSTRQPMDTPEENLLYFFEKKGMKLRPWEKEIIRIVRKLQQYFYPQAQTKVSNEGYASFWHYTLVNALYDRGHVSEKFMLEFMKHHSNVVFQPDYDDPRYSGLNPYKLGFSIYSDIRRICEQPTEEDAHWFPELVGKPWTEAVHEAMRDYRDDSFIAQFLSPKVIRDLKLFIAVDDDRDDSVEIGAIHDERGYRQVRESLSRLYERNNFVPDIQIIGANWDSDRVLTLRHTRYQRRPLDERQAQDTLQYVADLWGFPVVLESEEEGQVIEMLSAEPDRSLDRD